MSELIRDELKLCSSFTHLSELIFLNEKGLAYTKDEQDNDASIASDIGLSRPPLSGELQQSFKKDIEHVLEENKVYEVVRTEKENVYLFYYWRTKIFSLDIPLGIPSLPFVKYDNGQDEGRKGKIINAICKDLGISNSNSENNILCVHDEEWSDNRNGDYKVKYSDLKASGLHELFGSAYCFTHVNDRFHYYSKMLGLQFDDLSDDMKKQHLDIKNKFENGELTIEMAYEEIKQL